MTLNALRRKWLRTTDCSNRNSGSSCCGHEVGLTLKPTEKRALLEYLKTL
jgi:hypothetical protein